MRQEENSKKKKKPQTKQNALSFLQLTDTFVPVDHHKFLLVQLGPICHSPCLWYHSSFSPTFLFPNSHSFTLPCLSSLYCTCTTPPFPYLRLLFWEKKSSVSRSYQVTDYNYFNEHFRPFHKKTTLFLGLFCWARSFLLLQPEDTLWQK